MIVSDFPPDFLPQELDEELSSFEEEPALSVKKNIATGLDEEKLVEIGNMVYDDYRSDITSRAALDKRMETWHQLYSGIPNNKEKDTLNSSNVCIPLITIACHQYHARSFETLVPSKDITKCVSRDDTTENASVRVSNYMNYQLTDKMGGWTQDMSKAILSNSLNGFVVKKTYYDPLKERVVSLHLRANEFVAPYDVTVLEESERLTHIYNVTANEIAINKKKKVWINTDNLQQKTSAGIDDVAAELKDSIDKYSGVEESYDKKDNPYVILEQHRGLDLDKDGIEEPYIITVDKETRKVLRIESRLYTDPHTGKEKTFNHFTSYVMIPNPNTWMGTGFGHLLEYPNQVANTLYNQLIDSGKLANLSGNTGFIQKTAGFGGGDIQMKPGVFKAVNVPVQALKDGMLSLQFSEPSTVLFSLLQQILEYAQRASSVSDAMSGEMPASDTTATTTLNVMEQGLKVFSTSLKEMHTSLKSELKKIFILNSIYIDESEYLEVQNSKGSEMEGFLSGMDDFSNIIDLSPVSDPNITSRTEKYARGRQAYELMMQDPDTANDKESKYWLKHMMLKALEIPEIDKILKKPEPEEPQDLRPEEEEAEFISERGVSPLPDQDHEYHLISHIEFKENMAEQPEDSLISLSPQGRKLLEAHIKETMSLLYLQQERNNVEQAGYGGLEVAQDYPQLQEELGGEEGFPDGFAGSL